jgi:hypothetical protein
MSILAVDFIVPNISTGTIFSQTSAIATQVPSVYVDTTFTGTFAGAFTGTFTIRLVRFENIVILKFPDCQTTATATDILTMTGLPTAHWPSIQTIDETLVASDGTTTQNIGKVTVGTDGTLTFYNGVAVTDTFTSGNVVGPNQGNVKYMI